MNTEYPKVSIIVPVFNEEAHVAKCLDSLLKIEYPENKLEIMVIDNGSTDSSAEIVRTYPVQYTLLPGVKVGAVRNKGAEIASGSIFVFIDGDCVVDPGWLKRAISILTCENMDAVGGLAGLRNNPNWIEANWILEQPGNPFVYQKTLVGACMIISKSAFNAIGGFNEVMSAGEDSDLSSKLTAGGFSYTISPKLNVVHYGFPITIQDFLLRQMWHSSSYGEDFGLILTDRIFLLVVIFTIGMFASVLTIVYPMLLPIVLMFLLFPPATLSVKRLYRFRFLTFNPVRLLQVFFIDVLYLFGRSISLLKGLGRRINIS